MRTLLPLLAALLLLPAAARAQELDSGLRKLEQVAAELEARVLAKQISREQACEAFAQTLPGRSAAGRVWWVDRHADRPADLPTEHRSVVLALNCPGKQLLAANSTPAARAAAERSDAPPALAPLLWWALGGAGLLLIGVLTLIWRRSGPVEVMSTGFGSDGDSILEIAPVDEASLGEARAEREALLQQMREQLGALESQVQRMRKQRQLVP